MMTSTTPMRRSGPRIAVRAAAAVGTALIMCGQFSLLAYASEIHHVTQKKRAFSYQEMTVTAGDVVQFGNDDEFIHQVFVESPTFKFDTAESGPGNTIDVKFTTPGTFEVHCHIHPKMKLVVNVE